MAELVERLTAVLWVLLAVAGMATRLRRLRILYSFSCTDPKDVRYHRTVIRSSWRRLFAKTILFLGGVLVLWVTPAVPDFPTDLLFWGWRVGMLIVLVLLLTEDLDVDHVRRLLGTLESGSWEES